MWQGHRVSVIFPAYNEEAGIAAAVADFGSVEAVDEILVIDNNSRDQTAARAQQAGARVVHEKRQGYGHALRRGHAVAYLVVRATSGLWYSLATRALMVHPGATWHIAGSYPPRTPVREVSPSTIHRRRSPPSQGHSPPRQNQRRSRNSRKKNCSPA